MQHNRSFEDLKAGGPEDAKWNKIASCDLSRMLEDLQAGGPEDAKWRY